METSAETTTDAALIAAMPKAEIHVHLDGCVRVDTLADLAAAQGIPVPQSRERLREVAVVPPDCRSLVEYLRAYALPISVMQTPEALERVTAELVEDMGTEKVRYAEIRFAPALHTERGMTYGETIEAVLRGWERSREATGMEGGIILCALRERPPEQNVDVARAGEAYLGRGVVGFDLAGDEAQYPILLHREALLYAKAAGYGMTAHAGEAAGARSVRDAVEGIGVSRIGHGVRAGEDPALLRLLRNEGIMLEMCPTSNVQTRTVASLEDHPLVRYYRDGIRVSINTDGRTVSGTSMTRELTLGEARMGLRVPDLAATTLMAVQAGFADVAMRQPLLEDMTREMTTLGIALPPV